MLTLIAVPCGNMVHTGFMTSLLGMNRPDYTPIGITEATLIHSARNILAKQAVEGRFDRILWIDSDMRVPHDLFEKLSARLDEGRDFVCGLYFSRVRPIVPSLFRRIEPDGRQETMYDYPMNDLFRIKGCGFGACMMTTKVYLKAKEHSLDETGCDNPFCPIASLGEDLTFCYHAGKSGTDIWCDSRIKVPHIGLYDYTESLYQTEDKP